jgi:hypothetical protein
MTEEQVGYLLNIGGIILGWALGVGSTWLSDWRKDKKRARAIQAAISREFRETAHRMLAATYLLSERHGPFDRQVLTWMESQLIRYEGPNPTDGIRGGITAHLARTDQELAAAAQRYQQTMGPMFMPSESAPYTTSVAGELHDLEPDYAVRVLDILSHIRIWNEKAEHNRHFSRLTYDSGLSAENHQLARSNVDYSERDLLVRAKILIERISALEDRYPSSCS